MNQEHYSKLERMYLSANMNTMIYDTTTAKFGEGTAEIGLTVNEKYFHALGAIHGSVYFKLLDDAAFFAVNSVVPDVFVLTKSYEIHLKRPIAQGVLKAIGKVVETSDYSFIATSELIDEAGKVAAHGKGEFVKSKVQLSPEIGYK